MLAAVGRLLLSDQRICRENNRTTRARIGKFGQNEGIFIDSPAIRRRRLICAGGYTGLVEDAEGISVNSVLAQYEQQVVTAHGVFPLRAQRDLPRADHLGNKRGLPVRD